MIEGDAEKGRINKCAVDVYINHDSIFPQSVFTIKVHLSSVRDLDYAASLAITVRYKLLNWLVYFILHFYSDYIYHDYEGSFIVLLLLMSDSLCFVLFWES